MDAETGRRLWTALHLQTAYDAKWYAAWEESIGCGECKSEARKFAAIDLPQSFSDFFDFGYQLHCQVNVKLRKISPTLEDARTYWKNYKESLMATPTLQPTQATILPTGPEVYYWQIICDPPTYGANVIQNFAVRLDRAKVNEDGSNPVKLESKLLVISGRVNNTPAPTDWQKTDSPQSVLLAKISAALQEYVTAVKA